MVHHPNPANRLSRCGQEAIPVAENFTVARRQVKVGHALGLHLRVAERFVRSANAFQADVRVHGKGVMADGKSILDLLGLAAECGTMLALVAQGCDAEDAVSALANLISAQSQDSEDQHEEVGVLGNGMMPVEGCAKGRPFD